MRYNKIIIFLSVILLFVTSAIAQYKPSRQKATTKITQVKEKKKKPSMKVVSAKQNVEKKKLEARKITKKKGMAVTGVDIAKNIVTDTVTIKAVETPAIAVDTTAIAVETPAIAVDTVETEVAKTEEVEEEDSIIVTIVERTEITFPTKGGKEKLEVTIPNDDWTVYVPVNKWLKVSFEDAYLMIEAPKNMEEARSEYIDITDGTQHVVVTVQQEGTNE